MYTNGIARPVALLVVAGVALGALIGCSPRASTPQSGSPSGQASSVPTPSVAASAAPAQPATPVVDASGAAISSTLTVSGSSAKPQVGKIVRPSDAVAIAAAKKVLAANEGAKISAAKVLATTQDAKGHWWVLLAVTDTVAGQNEKAVISFDGKKWQEQVLGSLNDSDLPPDVRF